RWLRRGPWAKEASRGGRPKSSESLRALVARIAMETGGGYTRILGELRKLGFLSVSRTMVRNILAEPGIEPAPDRGEPVWDEFLKRHAETLWACDFFHK